MTKEPIALYKLIVLYMLNRVSFPLTKAQIDAFLLEREYTNYMTLQLAIGELEDSGLLDTKTIRNRTQLLITDEGKQTLGFFIKQIPDAIQKEVDMYLKENAMELKNETAITGEYFKRAGGSYEVVLSAKERDELLMELKFTVPDEASASRMCDQWQKKTDDLYALVMRELL